MRLASPQQNGREPIMDRFGRLPANYLVWLAAIWMPLGPSWAYSCDCQTTCRESDAVPAGGTACCRPSGGCCAVNGVERASCSHELTDGQGQSKGDASSGCPCKDLDDRPTSDPIAALNRPADREQLTQPPVAATARCRVESEPTSGCRHGMAASRASSGIERCILLCRFTL